MLTVLSLLVALACVQDRQAETPKERLRRLEEGIRQQEKQIEEREAQDELTVSFADGLRFQSRDEAFDIHVGARFLEHFRQVFGRPDSPRTSPDTFFARQAVLQIDGMIAHEFGFAVRGDFAPGLGGPSPSLASCYVEWSRYEAFSLRAGQFRAPQGQESMTQTMFTDFVERSILSRFQPGIELGFQAYGGLGEGLFAWRAAVTNGRSHLAGEGRSRNDDDDAKEFLLRLTTSPFAANGESCLQGLRLGTYASLTHVEGVPMDSEFDVATTELNVAFLDSAGGFLDGRRVRLGWDLSYAWGPLAVRGEYLLRRDAIANGPVEENLPIRAWYGSVTWLLTGEGKVVEGRIVPARPFNFAEGDWGALEMAFRVAGVRVGEEIQSVGTALAGQSTRVRVLTGGLNWYPGGHLRISANVVYEDYRDALDFGNGVRRDALTGFLLRFQIDL